MSVGKTSKWDVSYLNNCMALLHYTADWFQSINFRPIQDEQSKNVGLLPSPIRQTFKFENNFHTIGKSFLNLVKL